MNRPKDGITALTDIIGADWSPCTFTMKWQFTRAGHGSGSKRRADLSHLSGFVRRSPSRAGGSSRPVEVEAVRTMSQWEGSSPKQDRVA
ncbi:DUF6065 family protein [Sinorhizobium meliloti]|uniref:DUF6065 family protein n=1 Tax=Rhizobium meliloti TaxID=382 RepID=UPI001F452A0B|nr:DUF6065 family protein [Sinorhizobium meliloti]